ncbi:MAG TPA: SRPBCC domain-containing protein [Allocoleopsis sp.]
MKTITQMYVIEAPVERVWNALVDPELINGWGAGPAKMSDEVGAEFELWGGQIWGKNVKTVEHKRLVQEWYAGKWEKPSVVTFTLLEKGGATIVGLVHKNVPDEGAEDIEHGWKDYFMLPLKRFVESR